MKAGAIRRLFDRFDRAVRDAGYIAPRLSADSRASQRMIGLLPIMAGQIVDASLVAAPKQRNTQDEKTEIKAGRIPEAWQKKPARLRQKDRDASPSATCWPRLLWRSDEWPPGHSWTVKLNSAKPKADSKKQVDIAIPTFDYHNHVSIDREHRPIRKWDVTDAAKFEGAMLRDGLLDKANMASSKWADSACRSKANETFLPNNGFTSKVHRKKPQGRPMPKRTDRANARKSTVRARVEHAFAEQKDRMDRFVRTIGLARAELKIGMANLVYNIRRTLWLDSKAAPP